MASLQDDWAIPTTASIRPRHLLMRNRRTSMPVFQGLNNRSSIASNLSYESNSDDATSPMQSTISLQLPVKLEQGELGSKRLSLPPNAYAHNFPTGAMLPSSPLSSNSLPSSQPRQRKPSQRRNMKRSITEPLHHIQENDRRLKNSRQRQNITLELVETERAYVSILTEIQTHYLNPLEASLNISSPIIDKQTIADIFSNFGDILNLAREILRRLEQGLAPSVIFEHVEEDVTPSNTVIAKSSRPSLQFPAAVLSEDPGSLLLPLAPFLKCYSLFIQNFAKSLTKLHEQETSNARFADFVSKKRKEGVGKGIQLAGMLLNVVQRIPRYKLLLGDLLMCTEKDHFDYANLSKTYKIVDGVASFLNASIKSHEASLKLIELQRSFVNLPINLVEPGRKLLKKGTLLKVCRKDEQFKTFFLFSDLIIYASRTEGQALNQRWSRAVSLSGLSAIAESRLTASTSLSRFDLLNSAAGFSSERDSRTYTFNRALNLRDVTVVSIEGNYFEMRSPHKSFAVAADTIDTKGEWLDAIRAAKEELLSNRRTLHTDSDDESQIETVSNLALPVALKRTSSASSSTRTSGTPDLHRDSMDSSDLTPLSTPDPESDRISVNSLALPHSIVRRHSEELPRPTHMISALSGLKVAENYSAPVWVPDYKAPQCMVCQVSFGIWRRKHHCRLCGSVICYACSANSFVIPSKSIKTELIGRACDSCYAACFDENVDKVQQIRPTLPEIAAHLSSKKDCSDA